MNDLKENSSFFQTEPDPVAVGAAIRDIRRRRHWSQAELARRIGMRPPPFNNIERGRNLPSTPVLYRIAAVLDVPVDDLLDPAGVRQRYVRDPALLSGENAVHETGAPYHALGGRPPCAGLTRLPGETPAIDTDLRKRLGRIADTYLGLEDLCGAPKRATIPLHLPCDPTIEGMTRLAGQVRRLLGIGDAVVFDYLELFENAGLRVVFLPLPEPWRSMSCHDPDNGNALIFVADNVNPEKQLFRLLYELGRVYLYTSRRYDGVSAALPAGEDTLDEEHAARSFAARFLMPAVAVRTSVRQTGVRPDAWHYLLLLRLKHRFGVSAESFCIRLEELQLIDLDLAARFKERIRAHYRRTDFGEPGHSRRILSPNGRLGDLVLTSAFFTADSGQGDERRRLRVILREEKVNMP